MSPSSDAAPSAVESIRACLERIGRLDPQVNAFTAVLAERALNRAAAVDAARAAGEASVGPLAGVPFAVKNLFDVAGLVTLAGSRVERERPGAAPAAVDATAITRLEAAGAILVGALNMDEYAYGFTTENTHYGPTRNPHDLTRIAGGSSGGSGAAVAAGFVPITLGTDTNGSIRVPSSLCGVFGLRPTFGRLSRGGSFPFVSSLDTIGPFARSVRDLVLAYDAMQGADARDPGCAQRPREPVAAALGHDPVSNLDGLRIGRLGGWFEDMATPEAVAVVDTAVAALMQAVAVDRVEWPDAEIGRCAAFIVSAIEGGALHLDDLRHRYDAMEPHSRARFMAGALAPAAWVHRAQRVRRLYVERVDALFADHDVLLAPAVPVVAPTVGDDWIEIRGRRYPSRPSMGLLTQPVSCAGLPVVAAPIVRAGLPIALQVIAAPWREDHALRVAAALEQMGVAAAPVAAAFA
ncbi:MAG: AtzE family amidohydrolase [Burkholderiales bacterium]|nr:MAG: AtzE family amidohydrolase [Burkholderiales bacterium]